MHDLMSLMLSVPVCLPPPGYYTAKSRQQEIDTVQLIEEADRVGNQGIIQRLQTNKLYTRQGICHIVPQRDTVVPLTKFHETFKTHIPDITHGFKSILFQANTPDPQSPPFSILSIPPILLRKICINVNQTNGDLLPNDPDNMRPTSQKSDMM